jgi:hypothetical protein
VTTHLTILLVALCGIVGAFIGAMSRRLYGGRRDAHETDVDRIRRVQVRDREVAERRTPESVEPFDVASIIRRPKLALPHAYPGESVAEYTERLGVKPGGEADARVWSELRGAWVDVPACGLADKSPDPIDGETVEAFGERREAAGWFAPRPHLPPEWRWSAARSTFVPPQETQAAIAAEV